MCERNNNDLAKEDLLERKCLHFESMVDKDVCTVSSFISFSPSVFMVFLFVLFIPLIHFLCYDSIPNWRLSCFLHWVLCRVFLGVLTICSFDLIVTVLYTFVNQNTILSYAGLFSVTVYFPGKNRAISQFC